MTPGVPLPGPAGASAKLLALLPWGDAIEDFLDTIGVSVDEFRADMTGGWLFGYAEALCQAGWRTVIYCISRGARRVERRRHGPTGATICRLPRPAAHRWATSGMASPYAPSAHEASGRAFDRILAGATAPVLPSPLAAEPAAPLRP